MGGHEGADRIDRRTTSAGKTEAKTSSSDNKLKQRYSRRVSQKQQQQQQRTFSATSQPPAAAAVTSQHVARTQVLLTGKFADKPASGQSTRRLDDAQTGQIADSKFF